MRQRFTSTKPILRTLLLTALVAVSTSLCAHAYDVYPTGHKAEKGKRFPHQDKYAIANALAEHDYVRLIPGETYYINSSILVSGTKKTTLDATGATIVCDKGAVRNDPTKTNYKDLQNFTIKGGTWQAYSSKGNRTSAFRFTHAKNIRLENLTINVTDYAAHAIEIISSDKVTINNCTIKPRGKVNGSVEEQLQLDMATASTCTFTSDKKLFTCAPCKNVTITNNTIVGAGALVVGIGPEVEKYGSPLHENILIKNNKLTAKNWDALTVYNAKNVRIEGNSCVSTSTAGVLKYDHHHNNGIYVSIFRNPKKINMGNLVIKNNIASGKGGGILLWKQGTVPGSSKRQAALYKQVTISGNTCKVSAPSLAIQVDTNFGPFAKKIIQRQNKTSRK